MESATARDPSPTIDPLSTGSALPDHGTASQCYEPVHGQETGNPTVDYGRGRHFVGVAPNSRQALGETLSINDLSAQRHVDTKNLDITTWLDSHDEVSLFSNNRGPSHMHEGISDEPIHLGHDTENKVVSGQLYYAETAAELTTEDRELMRQHAFWGDGPRAFHISQASEGRNQPPTSQAAIERFERLCLDSDSIVSHAATWGTEQRGLRNTPNIITTAGGNFLRRLSLDDNAIRRPSIFGTLRGLVKKQAPDHKRSLSIKEEEEQDDVLVVPPTNISRRSLPPQSRITNRLQQQIPSINTAIATGANTGSSRRSSQRSGVTIRSGSSGTTLVPSPRSFTGSLKLKNPLTQLRNSKGSAGLTEMWKKVGGPPGTALRKLDAPIQSDNDDGDDDDDVEEQYRGEPGAVWDQSPIDDVTPNFSGFQRYVLLLNPTLQSSNSYLVDLISQHLVDRYKYLSILRDQHSRMVSIGDCPSGTLCIDQGGSADPLETKTGSNTRAGDGDESESDLIGYINSESFPHGIPMPPTTKLPAEFECQLCFQPKRFQTPREWTLHVHEDVCPYFCTWPLCEAPKVFKRKSDWARHENECHRHNEWYSCDIGQCSYTCYRRETFVTHLVRSHKYAEPKSKTKVDLKRSSDPTWRKAEMCHRWTDKRPDDEPCRFCGKTFPHWKELTVHLAKHMESFSLSILRLLSRNDLDDDGIVSPVQAPPPPAAPPAILTTPASPSMSAIEPPPQHLAPPPPPSRLSPCAHPHITIDPPDSTYSNNSLAPPSTFPRSPADSNATHQTSASIFSSTPVTFHSPMSSVYSTYGTIAKSDEGTGGFDFKFPLFDSGLEWPSQATQASDSPDHPWETDKHPRENNTTSKENQPAFDSNRPSALDATTQTSELSTYHALAEEYPMSTEWEFTLPEFGKHDITSSPLPGTPSQFPSHTDANSYLTKGNSLRQVALAKIRIQLLGLSSPAASTVSEVDDDFESSVGDSYDDDEESANDDDAGQAGEDCGSGNADTPCQDATGTIRTRNTTKPNSKQTRRVGRSGDDGQGNRKKRTRKESPNSHVRLNLRKFACPYQVYDPRHNCLRQSPRNPTGGCNGINRLKQSSRQHLNRRHMLSYRCQQCWISFDAKRKALDHSAEAACNAKLMPQDELLMTLEQEEEIERCSMSSEEDTWWWLFQQLIPGMRDRSLDQLKQQYSPYYPSNLCTMTIPPMNISNLSFFPAHIPATRTSDTSLVSTSGSNLDTTTSTPTFPAATDPSLPIPDYLSEILSVPIYGQDSLHTFVRAEPSIVMPRGPDLAIPSVPTRSSSGSESTRNAYSTPASSAPALNFPTSSIFGAPQSSLSAEQPQLRRAYDRLQNRYSLLETENNELRDASRTNRSDVRSAISLVDRILATESDLSMSSGLCESLEQLSDVLVRLEKRLK